MILVTNMHNLGIDHWRGIVRLSTLRKHIIEWHWTEKTDDPTSHCCQLTPAV